jgi:hypothetical protein
VPIASRPLPLPPQHSHYGCSNHRGKQSFLQHSLLQLLICFQALNACLSSQTAAYLGACQGQDLYADSLSYTSTPRTFNCHLFNSSPYIDPSAQLGIYPFPPPRQGSQLANDGFKYAEISPLKIYNIDNEHEISGESPGRVVNVPKPGFTRAPEQLRSIRLINLPEGTTYSDIAGLIRGGLLYEFYITHGAATATITFVEATSAEAYFVHVRNNGLYLKNKRVSISSSQFPPFMMS